MGRRQLHCQLHRLASQSALKVKSASPLTGLRRHASSVAASADTAADLEPDSSFTTPLPSEADINAYDPIARSRARKRQLPPSRYQFRPPKYYRGPLHPHQPPPPSSPSSRLFVPGPFTLPRLEETYHSVIAPDLLTLTYTHQPPGTLPPPSGPRLRSWDETSPYHKNRPLRPPRGGSPLRLLTRPITFRNIPRLERVTVHTMVSDASKDSAYLHTAGMVVQAITGVRVTTHTAKKGESQWGMRPGNYVSVKAEVRGEDMYHFLARCVEIVMPRIKDWKGVKGSSGDSSGNITFGLTSEAVSLFPEIEVNYDMYPTNMIPGCHITVHTSATNDKDGRLLLTALGIPFHGKHIE
ncbi:MAG: hypothetical protein M1833_000066 [Piccolia ochrophora]|nr:MAG: hypothetical protein M1833_000066 [Piccolia ochrophora]